MITEWTAFLKRAFADPDGPVSIPAADSLNVVRESKLTVEEAIVGLRTEVMGKRGPVPASDMRGRLRETGSGLVHDGNV